MQERNWALRLLRIEPGISLGQWAYDRIANNWERLVALFVGAGGMSYLAWITTWLKSYGPVGVGGVGLLSGLILWSGLAWAQCLRAKAEERRSRARALEKWRDQVDGINPLENEFRKSRINITDLVNRITRGVVGKNFIDCELYGPANIVISGSILTEVSVINCDVVVGRDDAGIRNALRLEGLNIYRGAIFSCTIFIPKSMVPEYKAMGANFITFTGDPEIDTPSP